MSLRAITLVVVIAIAGLAFVAWNRSTQKAEPQMPQQQAQGGMPGEAQGEDPHAGGDAGMPGGMPPGQVAPPPPGLDVGVAWTVPKRWVAEMGRSMRVATYVVPGAGAADGECAVYYFGPGQGGGIDANLDRWAGEFEGAPTPERTSRTVSGMSVTRVRLKGTYRAHAMMGGGSEEPKADHELLGAIVDGPNGSIFFKFTGPARTVDAAMRDFDAMLGSMKKK
jgi:hypothetical protein